MQIEPQATAFAKTYARGKPQVVWTRLVADLETPVSAFLKIAGGRPMSFLLESVEGGATRGRYSIIGIEPDAIWRTNGDRAEIDRAPRTKKSAFVPCSGPPLEALRCANNAPPWKIGCDRPAPMAQSPPAPESTAGQLKPPRPIDAVSDRLGNSCAVAAPTSAAAAFTAASAA